MSIADRGKGAHSNLPGECKQTHSATHLERILPDPLQTSTVSEITKKGENPISPRIPALCALTGPLPTASLLLSYTRASRPVLVVDSVTSVSFVLPWVNSFTTHAAGLHPVGTPHVWWPRPSNRDTPRPCHDIYHIA